MDTLGLTRFKTATARILRLASVPVRLFPVFPSHTFYFSSMFSIFLTSVMLIATRNIEDLPILCHPFLDMLTFWVDPLLVQLLSLAATFLFIFLRSGKLPHYARSSLAIRALSAATPVVLVMMAYLMEQLVLEPSLGREASRESMGEPWFTALLSSIRYISRPAHPPPSGLVMRQIVIFYSVLLVLAQPSLRPTKARTRLFVSLLSLAILCFIAFSRIYRGLHTLYDVSASISSGTLIFWLVLVGSYRASSKSYRSIIASCSGFYIVNTILLLYYAYEPSILLARSSYVFLAFILFHFMANMSYLVDDAGDQNAW